MSTDNERGGRARVGGPRPMNNGIEGSGIYTMARRLLLPRPFCTSDGPAAHPVRVMTCVCPRDAVLYRRTASEPRRLFSLTAISLSFATPTYSPAGTQTHPGRSRYLFSPPLHPSDVQ